MLTFFRRCQCGRCQVLGPALGRNHAERGEARLCCSTRQADVPIPENPLSGSLTVPLQTNAIIRPVLTDTVRAHMADRSWVELPLDWPEETEAAAVWDKMRLKEDSVDPFGLPGLMKFLRFQVSVALLRSGCGYESKHHSPASKIHRGIRYLKTFSLYGQGLQLYETTGHFQSPVVLNARVLISLNVQRAQQLYSGFPTCSQPSVACIETTTKSHAGLPETLCLGVEPSFRASIPDDRRVY